MAGALFVLFVPVCAKAQDAEPTWFERVLAIKAEQPRWMTPLVTVTPRLDQEFRYDIRWLRDPDSTNFGFGKGIELIPVARLQVSVSVPPYVTHDGSATLNGFGDVALLAKLRLWSSPESARNGVVTVFFGATLPTGTVPNGTGTTVLTPTLAAGKGWGRFDVQSTLALTAPLNGAEKTTAWNTALQLHVGDYLWPELEMNSTWFLTLGLEQTFITPGLIFGRVHLTKTVGLAVGAGVGFAVSAYRTEARRVTFTMGEEL
jgi:hypothetical protein